MYETSELETAFLKKFFEKKKKINKIFLDVLKPQHTNFSFSQLSLTFWVMKLKRQPDLYW